MFFALVAMVMMTMSADAQRNDNNGRLTFDRMASYLELRVNQIEPVRTALAQFDKMLRTINLQQDASKAGEAWEKIQARHKQTMKRVLSEKQYSKYVSTLDLTAKNTAERVMEQQFASK